MLDVYLVDNQDGMFFLVLFGDISKNLLLFGSDSYAIVDHEEEDIRFVYDLLDERLLFGEIMQSWAIEKHDIPDVFDLRLVLDDISGGPRDVRHYRPELADKPIE